jgi:hypothetical protein
MMLPRFSRIFFILIVSIAVSVFLSSVMERHLLSHISNNDINIATQEQLIQQRSCDVQNNGSRALLLSENLSNFYMDPESFVSTFASCASNPKCHIYYWHIGKTGGTTLQSAFFRMFPPKTARMGDSCCNHELLKYVKAHHKEYCHSKFVSMQIWGAAYERFVRVCQDMLPLDHEIRILLSFREPSHLTLSTIHQVCNKNLQVRPPELQKACRNCDYDKDKDAWDFIVNDVNSIFASITQFVAQVAESVPVMTIEMADINGFLKQLQHRLESSGAFRNKNVKSAIGEERHANPEDLSLCSFGMTSAMFKGLEPSRLVYRDLVLGRKQFQNASTNSSATKA